MIRRSHAKIPRNEINLLDQNVQNGREHQKSHAATAKVHTMKIDAGTLIQDDDQLLLNHEMVSSV